MNLQKLDQFFDIYQPALVEAVTKYPQEYGFNVTLCRMVTEKMKAAVMAGTYSHDGRAFKATCKALGIKHTRKAIKEFLGE